MSGLTLPGMAQEPKRAGKTSIRARILLAASAFAVALACVEVFVRVIGARPGYVPRYDNFQPKKTLEFDDSFVTDEEGVFRANPDFGGWEPGEINAHGFRSPPFAPHEGPETSILFVGDSFTWGATAKPIRECFVDRAREAGLVCHNAGVPGTDAGQYAQLAETWTPIVRPDVVATMICLDNDINRPLMERKPNARLWWITNAGWLRGFNESGDYFTSADEAYAANLRSSNLVDSEDRGGLGNALRSLLTSTVLGSHLWVGVTGPAQVGSRVRRPARAEMAKGLRSCLRRIRDVATANGARAVFVLIPSPPRDRSKQNSAERNMDLFEGFDPHVSGPFEDSDYCQPPNKHFNNQGHRKLADELILLFAKDH